MDKVDRAWERDRQQIASMWPSIPEVYEDLVRAGYELGYSSATLDVINMTNPNLPNFLFWLSERLVHVYGENPNTDFVQAIRRTALDIVSPIVLNDNAN